MLYKFPAGLKGTFAVLLILVNTLLLFPFLILLSIAKLILPLDSAQRFLTRGLNRIAVIWIGFNGRLADFLHHIEWHIDGAETLKRNEWYLVTCNHQSWADIPVIQRVLNDRIPLMKFFLKRELIWIPLLGIAWWALDFPFMKRHSPSRIRKQPHLRDKDLMTTRAACEKFRYTPVTIFNFVEGTRFTRVKHAEQQSPYRHLLRPRAGGTGFVLGAMGDTLTRLLDITIVYPDRHHGFWDYVCGRIKRIHVKVRTIEIPREFLGMDYTGDPEIKARFQKWLGQVWADKDRQITSVMDGIQHTSQH